MFFPNSSQGRFSKIAGKGPVVYMYIARGLLLRISRLKRLQSLKSGFILTNSADAAVISSVSSLFTNVLI